jgi:hypothetical protein
MASISHYGLFVNIAFRIPFHIKDSIDTCRLLHHRHHHHHHQQQHHHHHHHRERERERRKETALESHRSILVHVSFTDNWHDKASCQ